MPNALPFPPAAFTAILNGKAREIVFDIKLSIPTPLPLPASTKLFNVKALWDTGATNCAITKGKAEELNLPIIGKANVSSATGETIQNVYLLNLYLPQMVAIAMVPATECISSRGNFDFIIGMDIITLGDFALTNLGGKSTISFVIPPVRTIDFVEEFSMAKRAEKMVGRNDPCPCGSGEKYKFCCGSPKLNST
jgi:hypothetical protein